MKESRPAEGPNAGDSNPRPEALVHCKRLGKLRTVDEHRDCPYCFGDPKAVESGEHGKFCDHEPGVDPLCFGFPDGTSRQNG